MGKLSPVQDAPQKSPVKEAQRAFAQALRNPLRETLLRLADAPPQVLLLEGGIEDTRISLARWWAALLNCSSAGRNQRPCLHCPDCLNIGAGEHLDVVALDGRISNKEDEANPGSVRALTIDSVQLLRKRLVEAPHGDGRRVVIMAGLEAEKREAAANALLKALEEPQAHSVFVLLVPQREQLLPTLVSRSWTLTLPWPATAEYSPAAREWGIALAHFLEKGAGWFERTAVRGFEFSSLQELLLACQKSLAAAMAGQSDGELARCFASGLDDNGLQTVAEALGRMQDALQYTVNPALGADALATELYALLRRNAKTPPA